MRFPFISRFVTSPFPGLQEHAENVKECTWVFQQAIESHAAGRTRDFEEHKQQIMKLEGEADTIKFRIQGEIARKFFMPVNKFHIFMMLGEQDNVLNAVKNSLNWLSNRIDPGIPEAFRPEFFLLVDMVIEPIEELCNLVVEAGQYFQKYSEKQRNKVDQIIERLRDKENEADKIEDDLKLKIFSREQDPVTIFHIIRLAEIIGSIADHAQYAGDMVISMLSQ